MHFVRLHFLLSLITAFINFSFFIRITHCEKIIDEDLTVFSQYDTSTQEYTKFPEKESLILNKLEKAKFNSLTFSNDYNKNVPPDTSDGPIEVDFYVLILDIRDILEVEEEMSIEFNIQMYWKDIRLTKWNSTNEISNGTKFNSKNRKYEVLSLSTLNDIWHPDIFIDHIKKMDQHKVISTPASLRVYYDGTFRYSGRFTMKIACQMEFHYYPADTQRCPIDFKSYSHSNETIFVRWRNVKHPSIKKSILLPNFDIGIGFVESYGILTSSTVYSGIRFTVLLRRFLGFHMIQTYVPSCLFVIISFFSFFVSKESVLECLTLCMTTLLTLTAMFASVKQSTPTVSYIKGLDIWMVACIFCVFLTLLEHTVLIKLRHQISEKVNAKKNKRKSRTKSILALVSPLRKRKNQQGSLNGVCEDPTTRDPLNYSYTKQSVDKNTTENENSSSGNEEDEYAKAMNQIPTEHEINKAEKEYDNIIGGIGTDKINSLSCSNDYTALTPSRFSPSTPFITPSHTFTSGEMQNSPTTPIVLDKFLISPQFGKIMSKKERKRFKFSKNFDMFFSKLIPVIFCVFNIIYWPWLLTSAGYYNMEIFNNTTRV